jgi:hypothetical protein
MGLGRTQFVNFWYGSGPNSICLFVRKGIGPPFLWAYFVLWFHDLQLPFRSLILLERKIWPKQWRNTFPNLSDLNGTRLETKWSVIWLERILLGPLLRNPYGDKSFNFIKWNSVISSMFSLNLGRCGDQRTKTSSVHRYTLWMGQ